MAADLMTRMEFYGRIVREGDFGAGTLAVAFALLYRFYNADTGRCDPGRAALAKEAGVDRDQVKRAVRELKRGQWFDVRTGGGTPTRFGPTTAYVPSFEQGANSTPVQIRPRVKSEPGAKQSGEQGANSTPRTSKSIDEPVRARAALSKGDTANGFETLWQTFPNRKPHPNPKKPARLKFEAALKRGVLAEDMIEGAKGYAAYVTQHEPNSRFWKQLVTWLGQEGWTETHEPQERPLAVGMN